MNVLMRLVLICGLTAGLTLPSWAADEKAKAADEKSSDKKSEAAEPAVGDVVKTTAEQVTGQVSGIDKHYIGVVYQKNDGSENEMGIFIEGMPQLERVQDLSQIQMGDTVNVQYDVITEKGAGSEDVSRHVAKKITFVKPAPPPPPETTVLTSEENGQQQQQ